MAKLEVGKSKTYQSISSAIEKAGNGDEIIVGPDVYAECFEINKEVYIHGSVDLTKAKNNFSSDDIPIIYIKSFETLRISAKCRIENLLFTQRKDLTFGLLSEALIRPANACEITGDKIIHDLQNDEFETMIEISADVQGKNCFFVFGAYHGVTILGGASAFGKTVFSNCYADNIFVCNDSVLNLDNNCFVKNTLNGYGIFAQNQCDLTCKNSIFTGNECSSIQVTGKSKAIIYSCELTASQYGVFAESETFVNLTDCSVLENTGAGVISTGNSVCKIDKCSVSKHKKAGVYSTENSSCLISKSVFFENSQGIGVLKNAKCEIVNSKCRDNTTAGLILNNQANVKIMQSSFLNSAVGLYSQDNGRCEIMDSEVFDCTTGGIFLKNSSVITVNSSNIHNCNYGVYFDLNTTANIIKSNISKNTNGFYLTGDNKLWIKESVLLDNSSDAIWLGNSSECWIEKSEISRNNYGIHIYDNAICNCYDTEFSEQKEDAVNASYDTKGYYIHCKIANNKTGFWKPFKPNALEEFINCAFSNPKNYEEWSSECIKNIKKDEEEKLYKQVFKVSGEATVEVFPAESYQTLFDENSLNIITACLSQIAEQFGSEIFYKENVKKFVSVCKDFTPNNDEEIKFMKMLCEEGILEKFARKDVDKVSCIQFLAMIQENNYVDENSGSFLLEKLILLFQIPTSQFKAEMK